MRRHVFAASIAAILAFGVFAPASAKLKVVATLAEIGALAEEIGGERVEVEVLAKGNEDPHVLPAKPSHSRRLMKADLLIANGLQLEVGWLPLLIEGARNPRVRPGSPGYLELGTFIEPLEVPTGAIDRSGGDVHPEGNPHFTVDPAVYPALGEAVAERLSTLDPEGAAYYEERREHFTAHWMEALRGWRGRLGFLEGEAVVTFHQQWEYLARTFGLRILGKIEDRPGIPPTPRHLADLESTIAADGVRWILYSDLTYPDVPEKVAARTGCRAVRLPQSVDSREGTKTLTAWFDTLVAAFDAAKEN
ncbi:MAG: zinc ABC transporter substrate-binding protein [Candidatus Eisenbacteria bacterium]